MILIERTRALATKRVRVETRPKNDGCCIHRRPVVHITVCYFVTYSRANCCIPLVVPFAKMLQCRVDSSRAAVVHSSVEWTRACNCGKTLLLALLPQRIVDLHEVAVYLGSSSTWVFSALMYQQLSQNIGRKMVRRPFAPSFVAHLISADPRRMITTDASLMAFDVNTFLEYYVATPNSSVRHLNTTGPQYSSYRPTGSASQTFLGEDMSQSAVMDPGTPALMTAQV